MTSRAALVAQAGEAIAKGSRSFSMASRLFDRRTRERAWLLYAWCRRCDDLSDGQTLGRDAEPGFDASERLRLIRDRTARALAGEEVGDPSFDALRVVAAECALPPRLVDDHLDGFALDAEGWAPETEADLLRYCYHVAGAVGRMMAIVMDVPAGDEDTLDRASDLGIAFQLANIARDLAEDDDLGRCYLPADWLREEGLSRKTLMDPTHRDATARLAARLAALAVRYEASARTGAARLPFRARWAVLAAAGIYGDIARLVARRGASAWDRRLVVGAGTKIGWVGRSWYQALLKRPHLIDRTGLWTRQTRQGS